MELASDSLNPPIVVVRSKKRVTEKEALTSKRSALVAGRRARGPRRINTELNRHMFRYGTL